MTTAPITVQRGFIAQASQKYLLPIQRSDVDLSVLYGKQQATGQTDIHTTNSRYVGKLLWGNTPERSVHPTTVVFSRYLTALALDPQFRQSVQKDARSFLPALATFQARPEETYIFTEELDMRLYPYLTNDSYLPYGHLLVQEVLPASTTISLLSPERVATLQDLLLVQDKRTNEYLTTQIMAGRAFSQTSELQPLLDYAREDPNTHEPRTVFDAMNLAYTLSLEKRAREPAFTKQHGILPEHFQDLAARALASILYRAVDQDTKHEFTVTPEEALRSNGLYEPFEPPRLASELLSRQESAATYIRELQHGGTEAQGGSAERERL
jgi:hypothetical protein